MLTKGDISFMKEAQLEIRTLRERPVTLVFKETTGKDPITGENVEKVVHYEVDAVVTVISTDRVLRKYMEMGVEYKTGDIIVDVAIEKFPDEYYEDVHSIIYRDKTYIDMAPVEIGVSEYDRYEFLARREV